MSQVDQFSPHIEAVAVHFLGEPNRGMSSARELRWGQHGSMSVDLEKGVWHDHEAAVGGGVLDLVKREARLEGREAVEFLRNTIGLSIEDRRQELPKGKPAPAQKIEAVYDYTDENAETVFQVCRFGPKKDFRQRRPDPTARDGWSWSVKGVRQVPYRLPEIIEAIATDKTVFIVEGEKDADALWKLGIPATCNAGGAGKWPDELWPTFSAADVVILPDNDEAGRNHCAIVGASLRDTAASVRVLDLPDLPPKGDASDWLAAGGTADDLWALVDAKARPWTPAPPESAFGAIRWADIDTVTMRQDWLVDGIMFCGDSGIMFGASGSGKSFGAVHLALSIARGVPFLGKDTRQGGVIYQAGEGGKGLVKRLRAYKQTNSVIGDVPFILLPTRADFFSLDGDTEGFISECKAHQAALPCKLELIVIDTLSTASPGANENASEDMSRLLKFSERLQRETGSAVLWVHHKNAAGDRERGHTSLRANVDTALEVTRDEETNLRTLRVVKLKDGEDGETIGFELQSVQIGAYDDGKPMTSCVVVPAQVGSEQTGKKWSKLPAGPSKFLKLLEDAIIHKGGVMPNGDRIPFNTWGCEWLDFRSLYQAANSHMDQNAVKQALKRDGDRLFNDGLVDRQDRWIWITTKGRSALNGKK